MIQDIEKSRAYEQELKALYGTVEKKSEIIQMQDTIMTVLRNKNGSLSKTLIDCEDLVETQSLKIIDMEKKQRKDVKVKRFWRVAAGIAVSGILVNHLHWKYVKP